MKQMNFQKTFPILTLILVTILTEVISLAFLIHLKQKHPYHFSMPAEEYVTHMDPEILAKWEDRKPDPTLGWVHKKQEGGYSFYLKGCLGQEWHVSIGPEGERLNDVPFNFHKISIYGDSYIFGDDNNNNETIPSYLSRKTKSNVKNFGMGAYGVDQAVLRFESNLATDKPEIAILGVFSENINRNINNFRPFYLARANSYDIGFKPIFLKQGDSYRLQIPPKLTRDKTVLREKILDSSLTDYWYRYDQDHKLRVTFPFTINLIKSFMVIKKNPKWNRDNEVWKLPEETKKLTYILQRFITSAKSNHIRPIIVFIPTITDINEFEKNNTYSYESYLKEFRAQNDVTIVNIMDSKKIQWDRFFIGGKIGADSGCHTTSHSNKIIAEEIFNAI